MVKIRIVINAVWFRCFLVPVNGCELGFRSGGKLEDDAHEPVLQISKLKP
jgi:hypothetical protein